jgi:zinc/manganese transport system ATP-binding protein
VGVVMAPDAMVRLKDCTLSYDHHPAVHHLSGEFTAGSLTALVGPNGSGKSTLLKALAGLLRPSQGKIECGIPFRSIAYLPQRTEIDLSFPLSVLDVVVMGRWRNLGFLGGLSLCEKAAARHALQSVGMQGFERRPFGSLSVGQVQRVLFARVLMQDAPLVLLDEPFNAVDHRTTLDLLAVIASWHRQGRTVITVLHDLELVREYFPQTLLLAREPVAWGPTATNLTTANLSRARCMAEAWREDADWCGRSTA